MNLACRTAPKVRTGEPIAAVLVPLRYVPFAFINGELGLVRGSFISDRLKCREINAGAAYLDAGVSCQNTRVRACSFVSLS